MKVSHNLLAEKTVIVPRLTYIQQLNLRKGGQENEKFLKKSLRDVGEAIRY